jgi:hypothetical protein
LAEVPETAPERLPLLKLEELAVRDVYRRWKSFWPGRRPAYMRIFEATAVN